MAIRTFLQFAEALAPTVFRGVAGRRFLGISALAKDMLAEGMRQAVRASWIGDTPGNGPAYDALGAAGAELSLPRYPSETWAQYHARLQRAWDDWPFAGHETSIIGQLSAAGFPGAEIHYYPEPDYLAYTSAWSHFVVLFPAGTHTASYGAKFGTFRFGDGTIYGISGIPYTNVLTMKRIIRKFKPGHWICKNILFELTPGGDIVTIGVS